MKNWRMLILGVAVAANTAFAAPQVVDKVAAVVNNGVVLESDVDSMMNTVKSQAKQAGQQLPDDKTLRHQILEREIMDAIILQLGDKAGLQISDQQLDQAKAQLAQTQATLAQDRANEHLAEVTNQRTTRLVQQGWASKEQGDTDSSSQAASTAAVAAAEASIVAQQADVSRLQQLTGFEKVVAPFDGVVASRSFDVGTLVTADSTSGTPLLSLVQTSTLRIQIFVPQEDYFALKDGEDAEVTVPQLPGRVFHGRVARTAGALQPGTRTLLAEVDVDNADGALTAGLYCIVRLAIPRPSPVIVLPSQAVIFDQNGLSAAVYSNGALQLHHLDVLADNGATLDIRAGLDEGDQVVLNPPVDVRDGMLVQVAATQPSASDH